MNNINVCLSCDGNYSKYVGVVIASIRANTNNKDNLNLKCINERFLNYICTLFP